MKQNTNGHIRVHATTPHAPHDPALQRQIAERAYQLFQQRGGTHGSDVQDWLAAERDVLATTRRRVATAARRGPANGRSQPRSKVPKAA
jgi:hypothetical protein